MSDNSIFEKCMDIMKILIEQINNSFGNISINFLVPSFENPNVSLIVEKLEENNKFTFISDYSNMVEKNFKFDSEKEYEHE